MVMSGMLINNANGQYEGRNPASEWVGWACGGAEAVGGRAELAGRKVRHRLSPEY